MSIERAFNLYLKRASAAERPAIMCCEYFIRGEVCFKWHYVSNYRGGNGKDSLLTHWASLALEAGCTNYSEAIGREDLRKVAVARARAEDPD